MQIEHRSTTKRQKQTFADTRTGGRRERKSRAEPSRAEPSFLHVRICSGGSLHFCHDSAAHLAWRGVVWRGVVAWGGEDRRSAMNLFFLVHQKIFLSIYLSLSLVAASIPFYSDRHVDVRRRSAHRSNAIGCDAMPGRAREKKAKSS